MRTYILCVYVGKVFVKTNIKTLRKRIVRIHVNVFKIVIRGNGSAMVSAARAPVTATFSIRFDSPPPLKSGRLYIIIFIIIGYKHYYCYCGAVERGPRASPSLRF